MALAQRTRLALAGALLALVFFALGLLAAGRLNAPAPPAAPVSSAAGAGDAGASPGLFPKPRIALDPDRVELLPDASLHIELPPGFGGASAEGAGAR